MIQITDKLLAIYVPDDAYGFKIEVFDNLQFLKYIKPDKVFSGEVRLSKAYNSKHLNYEILGILSYISEEECSRFVRKVEFREYQGFFNYTANGADFRDIVDSSFKTAKESLISLLQSKEVNTNKNILLIEKL